MKRCIMHLFCYEIYLFDVRQIEVYNIIKGGLYL